MDYTVNQLAQLAGVSIRTLRFYDEINLLRPAYIAKNGYRYYQEPQLLLLQQILFLRELGFELKQIQEIIQQSDFDKIQALQAHKDVLRKDIVRKRALLKTIDKTIQHLEGKKTMNAQELFEGFNPEKQKRYEEYLIARFGAKAEKHIEESKRNVQQWTKTDWERVKQEFDSIHKELTNALERKLKPDSDEVQKIIGRHYELIKKFWAPMSESYAGLGQMYIEHPEFKEMYAQYHPELAQFLADAMSIYAKRSL